MITEPTACRWYQIAPDGRVTSSQVNWAWDDPCDRQGDGEAEADAFLDATRCSGFDVQRVNLAVSGADVSADALRVYRATDGDDTNLFALAVIPAPGYWDEGLNRWVDCTG